MPLGLPVVPEVYRMKSGCSASCASGVCSVDCRAVISCHQTSRPSVQEVSWPVRRTTRTCSTCGVLVSASSIAGFRAVALPRR